MNDEARREQLRVIGVVPYGAKLSCGRMRVTASMRHLQLYECGGITYVTDLGTVSVY